MGWVQAWRFVVQVNYEMTIVRGNRRVKQSIPHRVEISRLGVEDNKQIPSRKL